MLKVIGITGIFGSGKSTVADIFKDFGANVIDVDKIGHRKLRKGSKGYRMVLKEFGDSVTDCNGEIDRKRLSKIVFGDNRLMMKLNSILHPLIISEIKKVITKNKKKEFLFLDFPLLFELPEVLKLINIIIVVKCSLREIFKRLKRKRGLRKSEVKLRLGNQLPINQKLKFADYIIDNSESREKTARSVKNILRDLLNDPSKEAISDVCVES